MIPRYLNLKALLEKKSLFLFGPRSTGKTTLIKEQLNPDRIIDLLKSRVYLPLSNDPGRLEEMIMAMPNQMEPVVIDEVQKLPVLLDEVHRLIENRKIRFLLSGSSARKLRQGGVNLLAGRAWMAELFPFSYIELTEFNLDRYLLYGGLPNVVFSSDPIEELDSYINIYIREEIHAESLVQNIAYFSSFLELAAASNGQQINYSNISRDAGLAVGTVKAWFSILVDSFIGFSLEPWKGPNRKSVSTAKFYFFDTGVANFLSGKKSLARNSSDFGLSFEHFIAMELRAWLSYMRIKEKLQYWRSKDGLEVDFIIGRLFAIEVKAGRNIGNRDLRALRSLNEEGIFQYRILVCMEEQPRMTADGIFIHGWQSFLKNLWNGSFKE